MRGQQRTLLWQSSSSSLEFRFWLSELEWLELGERCALDAKMGMPEVMLPRDKCLVGALGGSGGLCALSARSFWLLA